MDLRAHVQARLRELAPEAAKVVVAVSGGPDSVALLRLLHKGAWRLEVAHLDHALREEAAEDVRFVTALAGDLGVPLHTARADVAQVAVKRGWNLEDAARRVRYSFLTRVAKTTQADAIATGHTLNDQAETVLMQLLRGAAYPRGMAARREQIVRPLMEVTRHELLAYLDRLDQPYRTDPTNLDVNRSRAWLRQHILPAMLERYPSLLDTLARLATVQQDVRTHFDRMSERHLKENRIEVSRLLREDVAVQRHTITKLLERHGVVPDFDHVEAIRRHLDDLAPFRLSLPREARARIAYGTLEIVQGEESPRAPERVTQPAQLPPEVSPSVLKAFPDLVYRTRQAGDRIRLPGGTKKLSDLLIDRKVPREARDGVRLLASGPQVLWVEGITTDVRAAQDRPADDDTRWMRLALEQAKEAAQRGELPVGAVLVKDQRLVSSGANTTEADSDPTGHAEIHALRNAAQTLGDWRLEHCTLYVTLEPCPMCFGAMLQSHLPRLVYGARNLREGALGSVTDLRDAPWKRALEVRAGVLEREASGLLTSFFQQRRKGRQVPPDGAE
jgi:tRNA(Ile)-lysidine synthase